MVKQYKLDEVDSLIARLKEKDNIILTRFSGIKVRDLNALRRKLREQGADYKVIKNNLFKRALKEVGYSKLEEYLEGPVAVAFTGSDLSGIAGIFKDFKKEQNNFSYIAGMMDSEVVVEDEIKRIADLPTKEVVLSQIMLLVNGPSTNIAMGVNQIIASLARGIKAVAEKNA